MEMQDIRKYAELMREMGLTGLEIKDNGATVRLERTPVAPQVSAGTAEGLPAAEHSGSDWSEPDATEICSPMVGVFYASPSEGARPCVQGGDTVKKGDVLCIIEAMKLMNEISAEQDGVIAEVCVGNGQVVDYGHVLFRLRKEQA